MATTTNYSWTTPDDTDLVKDGAAAIRTLGSAIDTSFAADQGDLLLGGTSDIFEPLAIGAAATVLTSDGTTASWVAPAGGVTYSGVSVKKTAAQGITNATWTLLTWDSEDYDTDAYHDNSTNNSRITIPSGKTGYYLITGVIDIQPNATGNRISELHKNGSAVNYVFSVPPTTAANNAALQMSYTVYLTAADYIQLYLYQTSGITPLNVQSTHSKWQVSFLGA